MSSVTITDKIRNGIIRGSGDIKEDTGKKTAVVLTCEEKTHVFRQESDGTEMRGRRPRGRQQSEGSWIM